MIRFARLVEVKQFFVFRGDFLQVFGERQIARLAGGDDGMGEIARFRIGSRESANQKRLFVLGKFAGAPRQFATASLPLRNSGLALAAESRRDY